MSLRELFLILKGGPGSGNWGHSGRLGKRGGSAPRVVAAGVNVESGSQSDSDPVKVSRMADWLTKKNPGSPFGVLKASDGEILKQPNQKMIDVISTWAASHDDRITNHIKGIIIADSTKAFRKEYKNTGGQGNPTTVGAFWDRRYKTIVLKPKASKSARQKFNHEVGHAIYENSTAKSTWRTRYKDPNFDRHTWYSKTNVDESFAESYMSFIKTGGQSKVGKVQDTYDAIKEVLDGLP